MRPNLAMICSASKPNTECRPKGDAATARFLVQLLVAYEDSWKTQRQLSRDLAM